MDSQPDVAIAVRAESKAGIGVDGGAAHRDGNRNEIAFLPVEHICELSALLQLLTGKSEAVELLPVHFLRVDGCGVLLPGQIVLKVYANLCQLQLAFGLLTALEQGAQVVHALLHVACHDLVQSETGRLVELTEEILHEVLQESLLAE